MTRWTRNPRWILSAVVAIGGLAGTLVAFDSWRESAARASGGPDAFFRLTRGIGGGAALDWGGCPRAFDPRVAPECAYHYAPWPGGESCCAEHAVAAFDWGNGRATGAVEDGAVEDGAVEGGDGDVKGDAARDRVDGEASDARLR